MFSAGAGVFSPGAGIFFAGAGLEPEVKNPEFAQLYTLWKDSQIKNILS